MKTHVMILATTFILAALTTINSCRKCHDPKNPKCDNFDPCYGKVKPTADFDLYTSNCSFPFDKTALPCDTMWYQNDAVHFIAKEEGASYEWRLGADSRVFRSKEFCLRFSDYLSDTNNISKPMSVTLTVYKNPGKCFNAADTVYTLTRNIVWNKKRLFQGTFDGFFGSEPSVKKRVSISYESDKSNHTYILFINLKPKDSTIFYGIEGCSIWHGNYYNKTIDDSRNCLSFNTHNQLDGILYIEMDAASSPAGNDYLHIKYIYQKPNDKTQLEEEFTGTRVK